MDLKTYTKAHTQAALARAIGESPSFVHQWVTGSREVPIPTCVVIERVTKGEVTRQELRKDWRDIWPELVPLQERPPAAEAAPPAPADGAAADRRDPARANDFPDLDRRAAAPAGG